MTAFNGRLPKEMDWRSKVFDSLSFPTLILTKEMLIVAANQIFLNKMGLTHDEVVGKSCHEIFYNSKDPCAKDICPFSRVISLGKADSVLRTVTDNNGGVGWEDRVFSPIFNDDGSLAYVMESVRDVTFIKKMEREFKEAQAQVIQAEKMASIGQLAAGVAHEINNPLTGILFYASMLMEKLSDTDPRKEDIGYIIEDVNRCKGIVRNLLAYSRKTSPSKNIIQFKMLIEQSLGLIRDQKLSRNVEVVKEMAEDMMLVQVDMDQVNQAIINLVMNALAAMEGKGTLTLRIYREKSAKKVFLEVEDTGCGIPASNLSRIFDPFFTTKEPGKGTGLGLSTAIGIIRENGGRLFVKETSSKGTTFVAELPLFTPGKA